MSVTSVNPLLAEAEAEIADQFKGIEGLQMVYNHRRHIQLLRRAGAPRNTHSFRVVTTQDTESDEWQDNRQVLSA